MSDQTADRGHDVSWELSEVRTVLSRAENARDSIRARPDSWMVTSGHETTDPDRDDMLAALDEVIAKLARWRRTGRTKGGRR